MKKHAANAEYNSGQKLTIPVKTRSPLEAFQMLRAGQPIEVAAGYYDGMGELTPDFHMMDKIEKLHHLSHLRETVGTKTAKREDLMAEIQRNQTILNNDQNSLNQQQTPGTTGGTVS